MGRVIWTIGHSVHPVEAFTGLLRMHGIQLLADVRSYPHSKRQPQFNARALEAALHAAGIGYRHFPLLGGKALTEQPDERLHGYAAYMQTDTFREAAEALEAAALQQRVAYMCAEADWQHCHRAHISDYLAGRQWDVRHITATGTVIRHGRPRPLQGKLF